MAAEQLIHGEVPATLAEFAPIVVAHLRKHFDPDSLPVMTVLNVGEEAGEFTGAYRRWAGLARRTGSWNDMVAELADVAMAAYVVAAVLGIDLEKAWQAKAEVVLSRGWREEAPGGG